jgi:hypothetical protein
MKAVIEQFLNIELENLIREKELGNQLSFKIGEELFIRIIELFKRVNSVDFNSIPYSILASFEGQLNHAVSTFEQIKTFNPNSSNPVSVRDSLISQLEQQYDSYYSTAVPILTAGLLNSNDLNIERTKIKNALEEFISEKEKTKIESEKLVIEIENVLDKARQAAVEVGVSQHYTLFKIEAEEHEKISKTWLTRMVWLLIAIGIVGIALLFVPPHDTATISLIQFSVTKIIVLSVLFYGLNLCTKNYKAHKHNSILNKHRQNALNTFETFSKAAGNDLQTKNAVLLEATRTIFSNQQTGYLNNENESDSPNKIIEIFKSVNDKN